MNEFTSFLECRISIGAVYRKIGFWRFLWHILMADKRLLIKRTAAGFKSKFSIIFKKYRYALLLTYLKALDVLDVTLRKRHMIPLHRKLKAHLMMQAKSWKSHIYAGGYYYQGWLDIGVRGLRETNKRLEDYGINEYLSVDKNVLDIGSNNGFLALKVARRVKSVDAIELNPFLVSIGKEVQQFLSIKNVTFITADFSKIEINKTYDIIFSLANHLTGDGNLNTAFREYMERLHALLNDNGYVMFESHAYESNDPHFRIMIEGIGDLFEIKKEVSIPQYKINYIGDRLFFVLLKREMTTPINRDVK